MGVASFAGEPRAAADWWPEGWYDQASVGRPGYYPDIDAMEIPFYWDTAGPADVLSIGFIRMYQTTLSRYRTGNCPLHPSCSRYGLRAIHDYGVVFGWLMTLDRMFYRENGDIYRAYPRVDVHLESRPYDPPRFDYLFGDMPWPPVTLESEKEW